MKTARVVGGLGPESTIDCYRSVIDLYQQSPYDPAWK